MKNKIMFIFHHPLINTEDPILELDCLNARHASPKNLGNVAKEQSVLFYVISLVVGGEATRVAKWWGKDASSYP